MVNDLKIKILDLAILLLNVHRAAQEPAIGFVDANQSLDTLTSKLDRTISIDRSLIESALWSSNMLDEDGKFWHPRDMSFEKWHKELLKKEKYNRYYGVLE